ncbi:MAG: outer membrane protein assembly factor BamB [Gammaproteobacteria bacterium]|nr:outer membrane protein assembly factor BamB [Gammaproteobacteria bacterium]
MLKHAKVAAFSLVAVLALSGCETNEEELETSVAELKPLNTETEVDVEWRSSVGSGIGKFYSNLSPVVVGDVIYAASREGKVMAFNKDDGDKIWQSDIRENPPKLWTYIMMEPVKSAKLSGGLTAAYNNLYMGTEDGYVVALSQETGEVLWRTEVKGEVVSAPAAGDGWIAVSTTSGHVAALHPDSGEIRWQLETDVPALSLRGTSSPTIANGGVLVGTATGKLSVILLDKGVPAWEQPIATIKGSTELERLVDADSKVLVVGTTVYAIAYNGNLVALDMMSGRALWKREYSSYRNVSAELNTLYLTDAKGSVTSVDLANGIEKWTNSELYNRHLTEPVVYKNTIVVGDFEGYFHFIDKETGRIIARYRHFNGWLTNAEGGQAQPVVADDKLYVLTRDGVLTAITLPEIND